MVWLTVYSVCGFVAVVILSAVSGSLVKPATGRFATLRTFLRRILYDGVLVSVLVLFAVWLDSKNVGQFCLGGLAGVALGWVWSLGVLTIVGLHWVFSDQTGNAVSKVEVDEDGEPVGPAPHWQLTEQGDILTIRFDTMRFRAESHGPGDDDGSFLYDIHQLAEQTWKPSLADEGWTEHDWGDFNFEEFELRRTGDAVWEWRLTGKYWERRSIQAAQRRAEGGHEKMPDERKWGPIHERWVPAIEIAYQRYIHRPATPVHQ